jgi:hypothetical protein
MHGSRIEKEVEIRATNLADKTNCMSTNENIQILHVCTNFSISLHWCSCTCFYWLGFVAQISISFSILVPCMCIHYDNFYCIFSCYPAKLAWSQVIK